MAIFWMDWWKVRLKVKSNRFVSETCSTLKNTPTLVQLFFYQTWTKEHYGNLWWKLYTWKLNSNLSTFSFRYTKNLYWLISSNVRGVSVLGSCYGRCWSFPRSDVRCYNRNCRMYSFILNGNICENVNGLPKIDKIPTSVWRFSTKHL